MSYSTNIGAYPAKTAEGTAGWAMNIGCDQQDLFDAGAPYWADVDRNLYLIAGEDLSIDVECYGDATLSFQWYRDGASQVSHTSRILTINSCASSDGGIWHCVATNSVGSSSTLPLFVQIRTDTRSDYWSMNIGACQRKNNPSTSMYMNIGACPLNADELDTSTPVDAIAEIALELDIEAAGEVLSSGAVSAVVEIALDLQITASPVVAGAVDAEATIGLDLQITADASVTTPVDAVVEVGLDLQITANPGVGTVVQGSALTDNKRIVAVGNNQLWYEDI